jgi:hypothetical protein
VFFIISILKFTTAPPNPIPDNLSDKSNEILTNYKYPNFQTAKAPYWKAWPEITREKLKKHDQMEMDMSNLRKLEFKLREAWSPTDTPFIEH